MNVSGPIPAKRPATHRPARLFSRPVLVRLAVLTLVTASSLAGLLALQRHVDRQFDLAIAERSQEARLTAAARFLEDRAADLAEDLDLMAEDPRLVAALAGATPDTVEALSAHYRLLLAHNRDYAAIRLVDGHGVEILRIDAAEPVVDENGRDAPAERPPDGHGRSDEPAIAAAPDIDLPLSTETVSTEPASIETASAAPKAADWRVEPAAGAVPRAHPPTLGAGRLLHRGGLGVAGELIVDLDTDRLLAALGDRLALDAAPAQFEILRNDGLPLYRSGTANDGTANDGMGDALTSAFAGATHYRLRDRIGADTSGSFQIDGDLVGFHRIPIGQWLAATSGSAAGLWQAGGALGTEWILTTREAAGTWFGPGSQMTHSTGLAIVGLTLTGLLVINGFVAVRLADRQSLVGRLTARDRQFRDLEANVRGVIFQCARRPDGRFAFRYVSPSIGALYGVDPDAFLDEQTVSAIHPDDRARWQSSLEEAANRRTDWDFEGRFLLPDGGVRWWRGISRPSEGCNETVFNGVFVDINDSKRRELALIKAQDLIRRQAEALRQLSEVDDLTGAVNRRLLMRRLEGEAARSVRYGRPLTLAILDVDHFKDINDRLGHDVGDLALTQLVATCKRTVREQDVVARLGGEEFAVLLPETGIEAAFSSIERLRVTIQAQSIAHPAATFAITCSIGIAELAPGEGIGALMRRADQALYRAKRGGRNRTILAEPPEGEPDPATQTNIATAPLALPPSGPSAGAGAPPSTRLASACQPTTETA